MLRIRQWYCCWAPRANKSVYLAVSQQATSVFFIISHNYNTLSAIVQPLLHSCYTYQEAIVTFMTLLRMFSTFHNKMVMIMLVYKWLIVILDNAVTSTMSIGLQFSGQWCVVRLTVRSAYVAPCKVASETACWLSVVIWTTETQTRRRIIRHIMRTRMKASVMGWHVVCCSMSLTLFANASNRWHSIQTKS